MDILEKGTLIDKDLEIPFPKPVSDLDQQILSTGPMQGPQEDASSKPVAEGERTDSCEDNEVKNIMQKDGFDVEKNPYDEVIPVPNTLVLIEVRFPYLLSGLRLHQRLSNV